MLAVCAAFSARGQAAGTFTPYSIYGVGDLYRQVNARNKTMGAVGVAGRDRRYLNTTNPAAITAARLLRIPTMAVMVADYAPILISSN